MLRRITLCMAIALLAACLCLPALAKEGWLVGVSGDSEFRGGERCSIAGVIYDGYFRVASSATWDIKDNDELMAYVGIDDETWTSSSMVTVLVDGEQIWKARIVPGEKAKPLHVVLAGKRSLSIKVDCDVVPNHVVFARWSATKGGLLGVNTAKLDNSTANRLGIKGGALIESVVSPSPAESAGIRAGDVIATVNGQTVKDVDDFKSKMKQNAPGEVVTLQVVNNSSKKLVDVELASRFLPYVPPAKKVGGGAPAATKPAIDDASSASFVVDPKDLDELAAGLRKQVNAAPALKKKVDDGFVALMTFNLVNISTQSVATNVAEDLSTAMIKGQFHLVERAQLDKILKELKIQDSALIDSATAQNIGRLTGCDIIAVGSISDRGDRVVVNTRLLETATGKALAAERVEGRKVPISR